MPIHTLNRIVARVFGKVPLRTVLIVPFVVQIAGTVGLVAYRNGQQAVKNLANRLITKASDRIEDCLQSYLDSSFKKIKETQNINFVEGNKRHFVPVPPYQDQFGWNWLVMVVVPESSFMAEINQNTYLIILLCTGAFVGAITLGMLTARWITKPILRLNTTAKKIAKGEWDQTVEVDHSDEVGQLAKSFERMAGQLQESFAELTYLNEALRASDRKLRAIFNHTFQYTGIVSVDGILLEVNQTALSFGGLQRDDVIGKPLWECYWWSICQETQTQLQAAIARAVRGEFISYEVDVLGADNRVFTIDFSLKPIFDENNNVEFLIAEGRDITEHKQAKDILADYNHTLEAQVAERTAELIDINKQLKHEIAERQTAEFALKQQKEVLQTIFDNIPVILCFYDANAEIQLINKAFENTLGWSLEALRENDIITQCYPDPGYRAEVLEFMLKADGTWQDFQLITRTGDIIFISWANVRLPDGSTVGIGKDITEGKRIEAEILRSKDLLESIFHESADAIFLVNAETLLITDCNRRAVEIFEAQSKYELVNIEGQTLQKGQFTPEELHSIVEQIKLKGFWSLEVEYVTKKGKLFWGNLAVREIYVANQKMHLVRVTDITARKQAEEALRENALRERAIATVLQKMRQSLDINNIFNATTEELRRVLDCDRVAIYRFNPDWSGEFVAESMASGWIPLITAQKNDPHLTENAVEDENCIIKTLDVENDLVQDTYLQETRGGIYSQGVNYLVTQDIYKAGFTPCYIDLLERFQARAYIIVPIFCGSQLWGLLATYQNSGPRHWSESQISAVVQIGVQLGSALQQAQLLQHTQQQAVALALALEQLKRTQSLIIQTEKMSSLGRMVAGIAHEINNPVSFIYSNITPARDYCQDLLNLIALYKQTYPHPTPEIKKLEADIELDFLVEDWQKLIDSMEVGAERICEIVLSLRNFSRLDERGLKAVDIHEGIDSTLLILQHKLKAEGAHPEIEVIKNYGQLPPVTCYPSQLNQVFMNLLSNAIDALENQAPPRIITISTSLSQKSKDQSQNQTGSIPNSQFVVIRIADNGSGMSEAVKEKIFDPFFTTKPVGKGTGLGLAISYQIVVEKHKGEISCISAPGKGTEFIVEIPVNCSANGNNEGLG